MSAEDVVRSAYQVRRWVGLVEETYHEGGAVGSEPLVKAVAGVVIKNPFAGRYEADLSPLIDPSPALGTALGKRAAALLGGREIQSYGKGGIAGLAGEQEHVVACVTSVFGDALREAVGGGAAWISSTTKTASAGAGIDIPLAFKDEVYVRSHYDAIHVAVPDVPRPDELFICVAVASGGRLHHRVGGMSAEEARAAARA
ncbi:amino acid synthesis family protein [Streptomyces kebangsaanensis]|uniref:amino acid synthesis family protein n=1 Tax=Streptomyces kebangsaanensis TaxID=864058 RepID=UPI00093E2B26|nr:amino acid synthesis family protein [Streptomyces kebangsaanensis]